MKLENLLSVNFGVDGILFENVIKTISDRVQKVFFDVVKDYATDFLLLSGGLDTSIIACTSVKYFRP